MKTAAEKAAMYEEAIETIVSGGANVTYSMHGKSFSKTSLAELERLYAYWEGRAAAESGVDYTVPTFRRYHNG